MTEDQIARVEKLAQYLELQAFSCGEESMAYLREEVRADEVARWAAEAATHAADALALRALLTAYQEGQQRLVDASAALDTLVAPDPSKPLAQRIRDEFADFQVVCDHCTQIYFHVTNGRISKPMTLPSIVLAISDDLDTEQQEAAIAEATADLREQLARVTAERDALLKERTS